MDALAARVSSGEGLTPSARRGADHIAPDCAGQNFYAIDRGLRDLLQLYLMADDFSRLEPHFNRLGQLAGGRLDQLARLAERHPPVLNVRDRFGRDDDWIDYPSCSRRGAAAALLWAPRGGPAAGTTGLALFAMPRRLEDGSRNAYRIVRLKDKLGTRSMASGEILLEGAFAWLIGKADQGLKQMM